MHSSAGLPIGWNRRPLRSFATAGSSSWESAIGRLRPCLWNPERRPYHSGWERFLHSCSWVRRDRRECWEKLCRLSSYPSITAKSCLPGARDKLAGRPQYCLGRVRAILHHRRYGLRGVWRSNWSRTLMIRGCDCRSSLMSEWTTGETGMHPSLSSPWASVDHLTRKMYCIGSNHWESQVWTAQVVDSEKSLNRRASLPWLVNRLYQSTTGPQKTRWLDCFLVNCCVLTLTGRS